MTAVDPPTRRPIAPWLGTLVGVPLLVVGVVGASTHADRTHPTQLAAWVIGADLAHDLVLAPVVLAVGWLISRTLPSWTRPPVRWAAATSGVLALISIPFVRGEGRSASVPSLLDRDYGAGLTGAVAVVWLTAGVWALTRRRVHRMRTSTTTADDDSTTA